MTDYILNNCTNILYVKEPTNKLNIPRIDNIIGHKIADAEFTKNYFSEILEDNLRIVEINGITTNLTLYKFGPYCDYCHNQCSNDYYYCYSCFNDMCINCYNEFVVTNNQNSITKKIDNNPKICKDHDIVARKKNTLNLFECDICEQLILDNERFHILVGNDTKDICISCEKNNIKDAKKYIDTHSLKLTNNKFDHDIYEFGSIMDWIPLIYDDDYNMILFNYNADSKFAKRFAMVSCDNHNRMGYFISNNDTNLSDILNDLDKYFNNSNIGQQLNTQDKFYNSSIKKIMKSLNMPVHFG
jgi:hypothetical protein